MLHLQPYNLLVQKTLIEALEANAQGTPLTLDRIVSDFDYTTFHISNSSDDKSALWLSIRTKAWQSVDGCGPDLVGYVNGKYTSLPGVSIAQPEQGYDYTLRLDLNELSTDATVQLSLLKIMVMSYPFQLSFDVFSSLSQLPEGSNTSDTVHHIKYRDDENIYIRPSNDRITVIFETIFQDETDKVFGKVFLQEFVDARKRNRVIQSAPQVLFSHEPPLEISKVVKPTAQDKSKRFITFVLFPRHFQTEELQFSSICHLALFRNYFHYHIKCSKAYMHSRMRYRVDSFIKVLNRAKVDEDQNEEETEHSRRTISGRKVVY